MYIFQIMLRLVFAWSVAQAAALSASAIYLFVSLGLLSDNILSIPWPIFTGIFFFAALAASVLIFLWCTSPAKLEEVSYEKVVCFNVKSIVRCATWSYVIFLFSALVVFIRPIPAEKIATCAIAGWRVAMYTGVLCWAIDMCENSPAREVT